MYIEEKDATWEREREWLEKAFVGGVGRLSNN